MTVYPDATHGWDSEYKNYHDGAAYKGRGGCVTHQRNEAVAKQSLEFVTGFLSTKLAKLSVQQHASESRAGSSTASGRSRLPAYSRCILSAEAATVIGAGERLEFAAHRSTAASDRSAPVLPHRSSAEGAADWAAGRTTKTLVSPGSRACARQVEIRFHPLAGDLTTLFIDRPEHSVRLRVIRHDVERDGDRRVIPARSSRSVTADSCCSWRRITSDGGLDQRGERGGRRAAWGSSCRAPSSTARRAPARTRPRRIIATAQPSSSSFLITRAVQPSSCQRRSS